MNLLWPAALTGLLVLTLPLIIHWLQRGEYRRIEFSTTRHLQHREKTAVASPEADRDRIAADASVAADLCRADSGGALAGKHGTSGTADGVAADFRHV